MSDALTDATIRDLVRHCKYSGDQHDEDLSGAAAHMQAQATELESLREENKRLREALVDVREEHLRPLSQTHYYHWSESWQRSHDKALQTISAALATPTPNRRRGRKW